MLKRLIRACIDGGLNPGWVGCRRVRRETVHPKSVAHNPLPRNVASHDDG